MSKIYVRRSPDTAARNLAGEMMVMSVTDSTLFSLDEVASIIWNAADGSRELAEIVEQLIVPEFEVEPQTAYLDALEFVEQLAQHGILRISDSPMAETRGPR